MCVCFPGGWLEAGTKEKGGQEHEPHNYTPLGRVHYPVHPAAKDARKYDPCFGWPCAQLKNRGSATTEGQRADTKGQIAGSSPQLSAGGKRHVTNITERPKVMAWKNGSLGEN